jgi:hypothetical protein
VAVFGGVHNWHHSCLPVGASIFLAREIRKSLYEIFFPAYVESLMNCSGWPDLTDGRTVSLSCATADRVAVGHLVSHIHVTHVVVVICHNE